MASIDEAYLDLSGTERLHGPPLAAAHALLREIGAEDALPCSVGLARTRLVAKVASDQAKPRGLVWVPAGAEAEFLAPLGVRRIPGIGKVTEAALHKLGIETRRASSPPFRSSVSRNISASGARRSTASLAAKTPTNFSSMPSRNPSRTATHSARTPRDRAVLDAMLSRLCQKAGKRLRDSGLDARTVTLTIRYAGFETVTRAKTLPKPTHLDPLFLETRASFLTGTGTAVAPCG